MQYRRLGRTGLRVSAIALGTVELGLDYGILGSADYARPPATEARRLLHHALDLGINMVDTAPAYGDSERLIGEALHSRRAEYILATKVRHDVVDHARNRELRRHVERSIAASLRALRTDAIDLVQIHSATIEVIGAGEMLRILQDARQAGHLRYIGATTYGEAAALAAIDDGGYDCIQIAYNLLDRQPEECVLPLAQHRDIGVIARSVLLKGALTHRAAYLPPALAGLKEAVNRLGVLPSAGMAGLPEMAYGFVLAHAAVSTALVGTSRAAELDEVVAFAGAPPLPATVVGGIRKIAVDDRNQLNPQFWPAQEAQ